MWSIDVIEREKDTAIVVVARNIFLATVATVVGGFLALAPVISAFTAITVGEFGTSAFMAIVAIGIGWTAWGLGWQPKPHYIAFDESGITAAGYRFGYQEIEAHGISDLRGSAYSRASMPVSQSTTLEFQLYIQKGGQKHAVTVPLRNDEARGLLTKFGKLLKHYRRAYRERRVK